VNDELAKLKIAMTLEFVRLSVVTVPLVSVAILMNSEIFLRIGSLEVDRPSCVRAVDAEKIQDSVTMLDEDGMVLMSTSQLRTKRVHYESLDRYIKFRSTKHAEMR
jgi:hypothetical protein